jgi:tetratricopeptide (TPR) repeat protein
MEGHSVSQESLQRFRAGTASPEERREIARHLLQGCALCRHALRSDVVPLPPSVPFLGAGYERAFEAASRALANFRRREAARVAVEELLQHPGPRQEMLVRHQSRYWTTEICNELASCSHDLRFSDLRCMLQRARLAVIAAERICRGSDPEESATTCRVRAWISLGNSLRVLGDLRGAEQALRRAARFFAPGSCPPVLRADHLRTLASLRFDQRQFRSAVALTRQEIAIRRDLHVPREVAHSLIQLAIALGEGGEPDQALDVLGEAERTVGGQNDPRLAAILRHNIIRFRLDQGEAAQARQLFEESQHLYLDAADSLIQTKAFWLEGQILSAAAAPEAAVLPLTTARDRFLEQGASYEAALAGLDLAIVFDRLGHRRDVRRLAANALRELRARRIEPESLAALILLRRSS